MDTTGEVEYLEQMKRAILAQLAAIEARLKRLKSL
jgi:hypothetical protein